MAPIEREGVQTVDETTIRQSESVQRWLESRAGLWGPDGVDDSLVPGLLRFCQFAGKDPDALIDECLRPKGEGGIYLLRTRARRAFIDLIEAYEAAVGSRSQANVARSFFIHNGVAMNPPVLR
jgi:hypothetical protein